MLFSSNDNCIIVYFRGSCTSRQRYRMLLMKIHHNWWSQPGAEAVLGMFLLVDAVRFDHILHAGSTGFGMSTTIFPVRMDYHDVCQYIRLNINSENNTVFFARGGFQVAHDQYWMYLM